MLRRLEEMVMVIPFWLAKVSNGAARDSICFDGAVRHI